MATETAAKASAESVGPGEAVGDDATGPAAGGKPRGQVDFGAGAGLALPPGETVGEAEHLGIGKPTRFVALQNNAAAARHERYVVELDDQHAAIVADKRDGVAAFGAQANPRDGALCRGQDLLAGAGLGHRLLAVDDK